MDIHLVEEFQHLIDESLKSAENNTNILILKIAVPVVAAMAFEPLISLVDTYYVGQFLGTYVLLSSRTNEDRLTHLFRFHLSRFLLETKQNRFCLALSLRALGESLRFWSLCLEFLGHLHHSNR